MRKKQKENYLDNIPAININSWDIEEGIVIIHRANKGFYNKLAQKFFSAPPVSHIKLEDYGSFVWQQIDGKRTISQIGALVKEEFGASAEPIYQRLSKYFYTLCDTKFITFEKRTNRDE